MTPGWEQGQGWQPWPPGGRQGAFGSQGSGPSSLPTWGSPAVQQAARRGSTVDSKDSSSSPTSTQDSPGSSASSAASSCTGSQGQLHMDRLVDSVFRKEIKKMLNGK